MATRALFLGLVLALLSVASAPVRADVGGEGASVVAARPSRHAPGPTGQRRALRALRAGEKALAAGKAALALDDFRRAVRLSPGASDYKALGRAYEALGRRYKAVWAYRRALGYAPDPALRSRIEALKAGEAEELRDARAHAGPRPKP